MNDWQPDASLDTLKKRAQMLAYIRAFFQERSVMEVETPALSQAANTDPYIESFEISPEKRFLHTSPEFPMKRLLAAGSGDIYQICKVWRKGESGKKHNPEFTLLEWYRVGFHYHELMKEVDSLLSPLLNINKNTIFYSYRQIFVEFLNIDPHKAEHSPLLAVVKDLIPELEIGAQDNWSKQDLLDSLLTHCIEPQFENDRLTFLYDYPATQAALANIRKTHDEDIVIAERFEVYLGDIELGNGYQELTDVNKNSQIFDIDLKLRKQKQQRTYPADHNFLTAMQHGMPESSGVAIGIDRLMMCQMGTDKIQEVISFPWDKA